jgi:hypothetical protein
MSKVLAKGDKIFLIVLSLLFFAISVMTSLILIFSFVFKKMSGSSSKISSSSSSSIFFESEVGIDSTPEISVDFLFFSFGTI